MLNHHGIFLNLLQNKFAYILVAVGEFLLCGDTFEALKTKDHVFQENWSFISDEVSRQRILVFHLSEVAVESNAQLLVFGLDLESHEYLSFQSDHQHLVHINVIK